MINKAVQTLVSSTNEGNCCNYLLQATREETDANQTRHHPDHLTLVTIVFDVENKNTFEGLPMKPVAIEDGVVGNTPTSPSLV